MRKPPTIRVESYVQTPEGEVRFEDLPPDKKREAATTLKQTYMAALFPNARFRVAATALALALALSGCTMEEAAQVVRGEVHRDVYTFGDPATVGRDLSKGRN